MRKKRQHGAWKRRNTMICMLRSVQHGKLKKTSFSGMCWRFYFLIDMLYAISSVLDCQQEHLYCTAWQDCAASNACSK